MQLWVSRQCSFRTIGVLLGGIEMSWFSTLYLFIDLFAKKSIQVLYYNRNEKTTRHYSLEFGYWAVSIGDTRSSYLCNLHDNLPCVTWQGTVEMGALKPICNFCDRWRKKKVRDLRRNIGFEENMSVVWICGMVPHHGNMVSEPLEVDDSRQGEDKTRIYELMRWPLYGLKSEIKLQYFFFAHFRLHSW